MCIRDRNQLNPNQGIPPSHEPGPLVSGRWNYHNGLSSQFPVESIRVVYAKAGTQPASCLVHDSKAACDHMLYWTKIRDEREGRFLVAILNSETIRARTASLQARGQWGARHFDKVMFNLPIPRFDAAVPLHMELAAAAAEAEQAAAAVDIPERAGFQRARRLVRGALAEASIAQRIDALVTRLLDRS